MFDKMRRVRWKEVPFVSIGLVVINVLVFLICQFDGGRLLELGDLSVSGVLVRREYGRFLWSMFLHGDIQHICNNMIMLYFMGTMIEKEIGHFPYGAIYFLSGIGGGFLSLYMKVMLGNPRGSIGASGAIFGLDGLLLAMVLFYRRPMPMVTPVRASLMIGLSLYSGLNSGNIDNAAHFGGLLVGLLTGALFCMVKKYTKGISALRNSRDEDRDED